MKVPAGRQLGFGAAIVVVAGAIAGALVLLGSPGEERQRQLDRRRVDDLRQIAGAVDLYWTRVRRLPESLEELAADSGLRPRLRDPSTGQPYEYRAVEGGGYELCATFERESVEPFPGAARDFWRHGSGRQCFQLEPRDVGR